MSFFTPNVTFGTSLQAAGNIFGGISSFMSSRQTASNLMTQGALQEAEAYRSANIIREEGRKFAANQSLQYIGAGVEMTGSVLVTVAQTKKYAETEAKAEEERGRALRYLAEQQADAAESAGRASLFSGFLGGIGSFFS